MTSKQTRPRDLVQFRAGDTLATELTSRLDCGLSPSLTLKRDAERYYALIELAGAQLAFTGHDLKLIRQAISRHNQQVSPQLLPALVEDAARSCSSTRRPLFQAAPDEQRVQPPLCRLAEQLRNLDLAALYALMDRIEH